MLCARHRAHRSEQDRGSCLSGVSIFMRATDDKQTQKACELVMDKAGERGQYQAEGGGLVVREDSLGG